MESLVSGGRVCKWPINLSRVKKIEKNLPFILYCAGWAVIDILFTTSKKASALQGRMKVWKSGGRAIRNVVGMICPLVWIWKKSVGSRPSGPVFCRRRRHFSQIALFITFAFNLSSVLRFQIQSFLFNITCRSLIGKLALTIHLSVVHLFEKK